MFILLLVDLIQIGEHAHSSRCVRGLAQQTGAESLVHAQPIGAHDLDDRIEGSTVLIFAAHLDARFDEVQRLDDTSGTHAAICKARNCKCVEHIIEEKQIRV